MPIEIKIYGIFKRDNKLEPFTGIINLDEKGNSIYYSWQLTNKNGQLITGKSISVNFRQIPEGCDRFEFSKEHAIKGIRNYRMSREKIIQELNIYFEECAI